MPVPAAVAAAKKGVKAARWANQNRGKAAAMAAVGALGLMGPVLPVMLVVIIMVGAPDMSEGVGVSAVATAEIPAEALAAYQDAGAAWDVDWAILAGVGLEECRHGTYEAPGCNPPGTMNEAGARGWMQFIGSTWRRGLGQHEMEPRTSPPAADGAGFASDGDGDGDADPWSWPDTAHSAARSLAHLGVADDPEAALLGYNHDQDYVDRVVAAAARYRAPAAGGSPGGVYDGVAGDVPLVTVEGITVHSQIGPQVEQMVLAARAAGLELTGGGYRDPARQIELRRQNCGTSDYAIYEMPSSECSPPTARPGSSNHELGLAIDLSCNGALIRSQSDRCFTWLADNAAAYGLANLPSEPWHWSVDGT